MTFVNLLPRLHRAFEHAADRSEIGLRVAGAPVRLRIAGADLRMALMPSLQGLVDETDEAPRLVIHAWSGARTVHRAARSLCRTPR